MMDVQPIVDWLIGGAGPATDPEDVVKVLCERMVECGIPLDRLALFVRPLHPNVAARAFYWRRGAAEIEVNEEDHSFTGSEEQLTSPIHVVRTTRREIRRRLEDPAATLDFPVLQELRAQGITDYLIMPLEFMNGEIHGMSVATRAAGGFGDGEIAAIRRIKPALTRLVEVFGLTRKATNILDAYLGSHAGEKVLQGRIRRGDAERIHAVIWFCDLRDSTPLADGLAPEAFLALLNEYFECVLGPVLERDGHVLRFIGDAALAIFPVGGDPADAATRAVEAARDALARMAALNEGRRAAGAPELRFGIGLHLGDVLYGNIGTRTRIEFTVIGAAANEAARIEALCKALGSPLVVSEPVARHTRHAWRRLGSHALRGVEKPVELLTL
ncbi:MAG TPA: adenylate/guanylate cyclase domain-containing protein [Burkholderiales bacterium]|nr:adenylate/guanylate cyclase domain-containing protein [Burkholderiales bacterium]